MTFADVAPVLATYCGACHQPDGPAPFSFLDYESARAHASQIVEAVERGAMPPWKAAADAGPFVGQPRPGGADIALLRRWMEDGAGEGPRAGARSRPPGAAGWQLGEPDLVVTLPAPYVLQADGADVFRIFVVEVPGGTARFVRGLEFRPGHAAVVHHANIRIDRTGTSRALDDADPGPGYDGLLARSALFPSGHFLGWTPGQVAPLLPEGLAWRLEPGSHLVLQLHLQPSGRPESVRPSVGFFFGDDPPERTPAMLRLGRQDIAIAPGERRHVVEDSFTLPVDVQLLAVQPHAHHRARTVHGFATLPDGSTRPLITIDDWDFRWQHLYRYAAPFWLSKGTVVSMRYVYDNSAENVRNPHQPPRPALWGQRSAEEMGDLWLQVLTRDAADLDVLNRAFRPKAVTEDLIGYESLIRRDPGNAALHDDAAVLYQELGRQREAASHFAASATLNPRSAEAHFNLGTALSLAGETDEAIVAFERALSIRPGHANAHNNLGNALATRARPREAMSHYRAAIAADATHAEAHNNLGRLLLEEGDRDEAARHFREALRLRPGYSNAQMNLGTAEAAAGNVAAAIEHYRSALDTAPHHPIAHNNLGRMLLHVGALDQALKHLHEAVRLDPQYAEAHFNLARALMAAGDMAGAAGHLRRAAALRPDWGAPLDELRSIERR